MSIHHGYTNLFSWTKLRKVISLCLYNGTKGAYTCCFRKYLTGAHAGNILSSVVSNPLKCIRVSETLVCQIIFVVLLHAWSLEEYLFSLAKSTFDLRKLIQIYPTNDEVLSDQRGLRQG